MDNKLIHLRCSSLPLAFLCPGSARVPAVRISEDNDASALGTAGHEAMQLIVKDEDVHTADLAERHRVDAKDLGICVAYGRKVWSELRTEFSACEEVSTELELSGEVAGVNITGHVDIVATNGTRLILDDWKFGRLDSDHYHQVAGYACLAMLDDSNIEEVRGSVTWMREQERERYVFTRAKAEAWQERLISEVINWDGVLHPGKHCAHCKRNHECEGVTALARRDVAIFAEQKSPLSLAEMTGPELVQIRRRAKLVSHFAESLEAAFRSEVAARGGTIDGGDCAIELREENGKRSIDTMKAWPLLADNFEAEEMAKFVDISATDLDELVATKAGKGKGAAAKRAIKELLESAGALTQGKVWKLRERRKEE